MLSSKIRKAKYHDILMIRNRIGANLEETIAFKFALLKKFIED